MQEKRLFSKNKVKKNYKRLVREIVDDLPLTNYSSLEPIRENIKTLFMECTLYELLDTNYPNEFNYWSSYVDKAIALAIDLGDIKIDKNTIYDISSTYLHITKYDLINILRSLYIPEKVDDFNTYINNCSILTDTYLYEYCKLSKEDLDMGNEDLNNFYQKLCDISETNLPLGILRLHSKMISVIFGYIHLYKIDNYDLLDEYFSNYQNISEKMELNNFKTYVDNNEVIKYIFDNLESLIKEEKQLIK